MKIQMKKGEKKKVAFLSLSVFTQGKEKKGIKVLVCCSGGEMKSNKQDEYTFNH